MARAQRIADESPSDLELANKRKKFLDFIEEGNDEKFAALLADLAPGWAQDETLKMLANQARGRGLAKRRKEMLDLISKGASQKIAAVAAGVKEDWQSDPMFRELVDRTEARAIAEVEMSTYADAKEGGQATVRSLFLKARAGWNEREAEAGFAQNITIINEVVDGRAAPQQNAGPDIEAQRALHQLNHAQNSPSLASPVSTPAAGAEVGATGDDG